MLHQTRKRTAAILVLSLAQLCSGVSIAPDALGADDLSEFLEQRGLDHLLVLHLEESLERATNDEREAIAVRLARLYARLLEQSTDPSEIVDYEARGRRLLEFVPTSQADQLRLAILRGSYATVERTAENHRLRLATDEQVERALETLAENLPQLNALRERLRNEADAIDRRRRRASQEESLDLLDDHQRAMEIYRSAAFINAWALYYEGFLAGRPKSARDAMELFWSLVDEDARQIRPDELSKDLLETEAYARIALGLALCQSVIGNVPGALGYLSVLEGEQVFAGVRDQVPSWRMAIFLENGEFDRAMRLVDTAQENEGDEGIPLTWVRLAAVHGLEVADENRQAAALASFAIAELASRGELNQVLNLAERYGTDALGETGFGVLYVRGVQQYEDARAAHETEAPTDDPQLVARYEQAETLLVDAMNQSDASNFPEAQAGAQLLIGWCRYFQSEFLASREAFEQAASQLPPQKAAEALWMAIVSLDTVVKERQDTARLHELESLIDRFIEQYPSSEYAPKLILRQTELTVAEPSMEIVSELQRIPAESPDYRAAQQRIAQMLYELYLDAEDDRQVELGLEYLQTAAPIWHQTELAELTGDDARLQVFVVRGRRLLDVALHSGIQRVQLASNVLDRFESLVDEPAFDLSELVDEFDYRRMQLALVTDSYEDARVFADRILERDHPNDWPRAAARTMLRVGVNRWRDGRLQDDRAMINQIIDYGRPVIEEIGSTPGAINERSNVAFFSTVAEAARAAWRHFGSVENGQYALALYRQLLDAYPDNGTFLRSVGELAASFGALEESREAWARLAASRETGTAPWYEAKYNLIQVLIRIDPTRAQAVYDQFAALVPEVSNPEWRDRFSALPDEIEHARRMRAIEQGENPDGDEPDTGDADSRREEAGEV